MPSLRSRMFVWVLKNRHLLSLQLKRKPMFGEGTSLAALRTQVDQGSGFFGKLPENLTLEAVQLGSVAGEWVRPAQAPPGRVLLYFHGGGYAIGSVKGHRPVVAKYVAGSGVSALSVEYRLAPEHPFPAGLEDAVTAYRQLLAQGVAPAGIVIGGDSAGGGLVLATLLALKEQGLPMPAGAFALSPWTDVANTGESWVTNAQLDSLTWPDSQKRFADYYTAGQDATQPLISPLYGQLEGLPPLLIFVGSHEVMLSDSTRFAEKARAAGVPVTLEVGEGLFHCYPACAPMFPEATQAMAQCCRFIRTQLGLPPQ